MEEKKFIFDVKTDGNEIIIRQGEAAPIREPKAVFFNGTIDSPQRYKEVMVLDNQKAVITINRQLRVITLRTDPVSAYGHEITGAITENPDLQLFAINANKIYDLKGLLSLFRQNRYFFQERSAYDKVIEALTNFKYSQSVQGEQSDNRKGNMKNLHEKTTTIDQLNFTFNLNIPVFKGFPNSLFTVDILMDVTDGGAKFWLESIDLLELKKTLADEAINKVLAAFDGYLIIEA